MNFWHSTPSNPTITITGNITYRTPFQQLVDRYRIARRKFRETGIAEAAKTLGMSEREYCDRYISGFPPIVWMASTAFAEPWTNATHDQAYAAADPCKDDHG